MGNLFENQDISAFYQNAINRDFARKNLFRILSINSGATNIVFDPSDLVYITTTTVPKRGIHNVPTPFMGLQFNVPGTAHYPGSDSWAVEFRMPQDLGIRAKLEQWSRGTFDDQVTSGAYEVANLGNVVLAIMGKDGNPLNVITLWGAYCTEIGDYALDITSQGEVVTQPVTLAYQFWTDTLVP